MIYIYESHMGGIYFSDIEWTYEELYCEGCGDSDHLLCCGETVSELWDGLKSECDIDGSGGYGLCYIIPDLLLNLELNDYIALSDENYTSLRATSNSCMGYYAEQNDNVLNDSQLLEILYKYI